MPRLEFRLPDDPKEREQVKATLKTTAFDDVMSKFKDENDGLPPEMIFTNGALHMLATILVETFERKEKRAYEAGLFDKFNYKHGITDGFKEILKWHKA